MERIVFLLFFSVLGLAASGSARAQQDDYADIREQLELCTPCHGETGGEPLDPSFPIIAGQHLHYLYVQLKDFKAGRRANDIMGPISQELEKDQMLRLAEYFSLQSWPRTDYASDPEKAALGETATTAGQCVQCHLGGYEGNSRVPRLAGQNPVYLERTMLDFKEKVRLNSAATSSLLKSFSDEQITGLAEFLGGM
jgi:cytochrome c553